jgi:hypothetical protein
VGTGRNIETLDRVALAYEELLRRLLDRARDVR